MRTEKENFNATCAMCGCAIAQYKVTYFIQLCRACWKTSVKWETK